MTGISIGTFAKRLAASLALVGVVAFAGHRADAQCQITQQPTSFDPPPEGVQPVDMFSRADSFALGGTTGTDRRLLVRYSYGFIVYGLGNPATPGKLQVRSLKSHDGYPKNGDGLERTNALAISADAARVIVPWTDTTQYGTVALANWPPNGFSGGGDYAPKGTSIKRTAIAKIGSRYLGFSMSASGIGTNVYVADVTTLRANVQAEGSLNSIPSEMIAGVDFGLLGGSILAVDGTRNYVVVTARNRVTVLDVTGAGPSVPNISAGFVPHAYTLSDLGLSSGQAVLAAAAIHPVDGALYLLVTASATPPATLNATTTLTRIDPTTFTPTVVGTYHDTTGLLSMQPDPKLLAFDTDLAAVFLEASASTSGQGLAVNVRTSADFSRNLAAGQTLTGLDVALAMAAFRSNGSVYLYIGKGVSGAYAAAMNCATTPAPATATLAVDRIPASGPAQAIPDGGVAYLGDTLRIKPAISPPDTVQPVLDWRLDYDFHSGNAVEGSSGAPGIKLSNPDESRTKGPLLPNAQYAMVGPCDPNLPTGSPAVPSTGAGCWTSVTSNGTYTTNGAPDFGTDPVPGSTKLLTIAFEAQNALNAGGSGLATHQILWTVPTALLKTTAMLAGGSVQVDPQGTPAATGYHWYFATAPVGTAGDSTLGIRAACTGATCSPGLNQSGVYRYWVSVPYSNGFRTPECPGLDLTGQVCNGDATKTVSVTDVVLGFTVPAGGIVGGPAIQIQSQSVKGTSVGPCPANGTGFTYDLCALSGGNCPAGTYSNTGLLAPNAFPTSGTGLLTIPMPDEGSWGVRLKYTYTTTIGDCSQPSMALWPASGAAQDWAPITVTKAKPSIRLRSSPNGAELSYNQLFNSYQIDAGARAYAYAELNGVQDLNPPAGMQWSYVNTSTNQTVNFGTTQGANVAISAADSYQVVLTGYGIDAYVNLLVNPVGGGGGSGGGPTALNVSALQVSNPYPVVNEVVSFTCVASGGTAPYSYQISFGDNEAPYTGTNRYTTHAYATASNFTARCSVTDTVNTTASRAQVLYVGSGGGGGGTCDVKLSGPGGVITPYQGEYYVSSGQQLTIESVNTTETASWDFGDGTTGSGSPVTHTYVNSTGVEIERALKLTAGSCSKTAKVFVAPSAGPDFTIADAGTGVALEWVTDAYKASAGQSLRFTATGTTGAVSWDFGDGTFSSEASPTKAFAPAVDTTFVVRLTNGELSKQTNVRVAGTTGAALTGNYTFTYSDGSTVNRTAVEPNKAIRFTGIDQATTYTWDFGDGTALGSGSPALHTFTRGGAFTVRLTVARDGVPGTVTTASPLVFQVKTPPDPLLWVAAGMVYSDGQGGARWQSDLSIYNPGTQTATFSLAFVSGASWNGAPKDGWITEAIPAGQTKSFPNALASLFQLAKGSWGVVLVRGDDIPTAPVIVGRTYNAASSDTTGTFGLSVPAMSVAAGVQPQSAAGGNYLAGLRHDEVFRTNLAVANLKDDPAEVEVVFRGANGAVLGTPARILVEGRGVKQLNAALSADPPPAADQTGGAGWKTPTPQFSAEIQIKRGSGVYPYATVIDQGTGDSIVVTPAPRPSATYRLPGILRYAQWVSDVSLLNPSAKERKVRLEYSYVKKGETDRTTKSKTVTLQAFETKAWVDFFKSILELPAGDTSEYSASFIDIAPASDDAFKNEPLVVAGKTYTTSGAGTVGLQVDPYVFEDGIGSQASSKRILLSGLAANLRFRTNVALFLTPGATSSDAAEVDVHVFDSRGRELRNIWVRLDVDNPVKQLGSGELFAGLTTTDIEPATIVISNPRGAARLGAYATVIDNLSNDATFVAGQPVP